MAQLMFSKVRLGSPLVDGHVLSAKVTLFDRCNVETETGHGMNHTERTATMMMKMRPRARAQQTGILTLSKG